MKLIKARRKGNHWGGWGFIIEKLYFDFKYTLKTKLLARKDYVNNEGIVLTQITFTSFQGK